MVNYRFVFLLLSWKGTIKVPSTAKHSEMHVFQ